jgi:hypothetical protein
VDVLEECRRFFEPEYAEDVGLERERIESPGRIVDIHIAECDAAVAHGGSKVVTWLNN